jgi:hypothetical protein
LIILVNLVTGKRYCPWREYQKCYQHLFHVRAPFLSACSQACHGCQLPKSTEKPDNRLPGVPLEGRARIEEKIHPPWRAVCVVESRCRVARASPLVINRRPDFCVALSSFARRFLIGFPDCCFGMQRLVQFNPLP